MRRAERHRARRLRTLRYAAAVQLHRLLHGPLDERGVDLKAQTRDERLAEEASAARLEACIAADLDGNSRVDRSDLALARERDL